MSTPMSNDAITDAMINAALNEYLPACYPTAQDAMRVALKAALSSRAAEIAELRRDLLAIAAGCHRAKWSYEELAAPAGTPSVFDFLHRLGDQANDAARALTRKEG